LRYYYRGSPYLFITSLQPEHTFFPWKFTLAPMRTWKDTKMHHTFFQYLQSKLNIQRVQDWYERLTKVNVIKCGGGGLISKYYKGSLILFLKTMIPDHEWQLWKFNSVPQGFWKHIDSRVAFFEWLCERVNMFIPEQLYFLSYRDIWKNGGLSLLHLMYRSSPEEFVVSLNPEFAWMEWCFRCKNKWERKENHEGLFGWIGENLGFTGNGDWNFLTREDLRRFNAPGLINTHYKGRIQDFLHRHLKENKREVDENSRDTQDSLHWVVTKLMKERENITLKYNLI